MNIEREGLTFDGDGHASSIEVGGAGLIVALRVRAPEHEPADPRAATFSVERQSGQCVLNFHVLPFDQATWFARPGEEIVLDQQHGLTARCDERRPLEIAYLGLGLDRKIKGIRLDGAGLRDMSQAELELWWPGRGGA